MIYDMNSLFSLFQLCDGRETIYVRTSDDYYVINGYEFDDDWDVILTTEKLIDDGG